MADIIIPTKEAHQALKDVLDQLAKVDKTKLQRRNKRPSSVEQWEDALRTAMAEIVEWCPSFTIEMSPKE
jgi:hypothetical protein